MRQRRSFDHASESVPAARRFATEVLRSAAADVLDAIELMVSELATNCIRHTDTGFELTITQSAREIRVEAIDGGRGEPTMRAAGPEDVSGRGLQIIDMLATEWGYRHGPDVRKTVWFTMSMPGGGVAAHGSA